MKKFITNCNNITKTRMATGQFNKRNDTRKKHLFDNSDYNVYDKTLANLSVGAPGPGLLENCKEYFQKATEYRMQKENDLFLFQYGPTIGEYAFRKRLSEFLTEEYQDTVHVEDLVLTSGASTGLHLILSNLIDMHGIVFVDDVTYMIALKTISQFTNLKVIPVPLTQNGVDTGELEKMVEKHKFNSANKLFWSIYYTTPIYHNPTGLLFSEETCKELIVLSRKYDFLIVCDDVYNLLPYNTTIPPKRLVAYDDNTNPDYQGNVISNGSFSKILSPGIRMGWMECPPRIVHIFEKHCGLLSSGGAINHYTSGIIESLIELGYAKKQLMFYRAKYKERMNTTCKLLKDNLPEACTFQIPTGGYFIWIQLPNTVNANDFNTFCLQNYNISAIAGPVFSSEDLFQNYLRISIGFQEIDVLALAIPKLCSALKEYMLKFTT